MARIITLLVLILFPYVTFGNDDTSAEQQYSMQQEQKIQTRVDLVCRQEIKTTYLNLFIADEYTKQLRVLYSLNRIQTADFEKVRQKINLDKQYFQWKYQALTMQCQEEGALNTEQLRDIISEAQQTHIEGIDVRNYLD